MCASVTSHEAEVIFSEEKMHSSAPSGGCPFLSGQRQKYGRSLQAHPGNLVRGWLLLPRWHTASSCPSGHVPPAAASQSKSILSITSYNLRSQFSSYFCSHCCSYEVPAPELTQLRATNTTFTGLQSKGCRCFTGHQLG